MRRDNLEDRPPTNLEVARVLEGLDPISNAISPRLVRERRSHVVAVGDHPPQPSPRWWPRRRLHEALVALVELWVLGRCGTQTVIVQEIEEAHAILRGSRNFGVDRALIRREISKERQPLWVVWHAAILPIIRSPGPPTWEVVHPDKGLLGGSGTSCPPFWWWWWWWWW